MPAPESTQLEDLKKRSGREAASKDSSGKKQRCPALEKRRTDASRDQAGLEDSGRERLRRHRFEMARSICMPDTWEQEGLLKDWTDSSAFSTSFVSKGIASAREALVEEFRRANSGGLKV
ncbi:protein BIC1-like [Phoenix dactylifera]|uniref:Protein BIC1-like n=1 Tax=Phoenix dactylifera TaxID=42345 RepID=A0A8B7CZD4_PHODC|nr:protein BIC1-like [Phoenix dactylifera]